MTTNPPTPPSGATLSVARAAHVLGVHPNTIRTWSEQGRLRYYRINSRGDRRYRMSDLRRFLTDAERDSRSRVGRAGRREAAVHPQASGQALGTLAPRPPGAGPATTSPANAAAPTSAAAVAAPISTATAADDLRNPRSDEAAPSFEQLASLAAITRGGRDLTRTLQAASRLIRSAVGATDVSIWERVGDRLVQRAGDGSTSRPSQLPLSAGPAAAALSAGRAVVESLAQGRDWPASAWSGGIDVAVPIAADTGPWGVLVARHARPLDRERHEIEWLQVAAGLLAIAVHSAELLDEALGELHRAEALRRVATDTNGTLEIEQPTGHVS